MPPPPPAVKFHCWQLCRVSVVQSAGVPDLVPADKAGAAAHAGVNLAQARAGVGRGHGEHRGRVASCAPSQGAAVTGK